MLQKFSSFGLVIRVVVGVLILAAASMQPGDRPLASVDGGVQTELASLDPGTSSISAKTPSKVQLNKAYGQLPLSFEVNKGQANANVNFISRGSGYALFLTPNEAVLSLRKPAESPTNGEQSIPPTRSASTVLRMKLVGANSQASAVGLGLERLPGKVNYFIGNDPTKWHTGIPTYAKVKYQSVYPGVDLIYYGQQRRLEYDFIVAPGASPNTIELSIAGADKLEVDYKGDLVVHTDSGPIRLSKPIIYQTSNGIRREITGGYILHSTNRAGFEVGAYDPSKPLVIDPVLVYSTHLGGSNQDFGGGIAVDATGHAYITGVTQSADFPTTVGAFDTTCGTDGKCNININGFQYMQNAFVTKLDASGSTIIYSTYIAGMFGAGANDIAIDNSGNAYITGSASIDFPITSGAFQSSPSSPNSNNLFVTKLNPAGNALIYSTYLGVARGWSPSIVVDNGGNAYITGTGGPPATPGAYQTVLGGSGITAFVTKLNATGSALVYSTYLGKDNGASGIAVDNSGNAYVIGEASWNFPFPTTQNAFQTTLKGSGDGFVAKLNATGGKLLYSTLLGGSNFPDEVLLGIAVDSSGAAYVTGWTSSYDFPTTPGAFQTSLLTHPSAFVTKLDPLGHTLIYSTYLGDWSGGEDIAIDSVGNAYITGFTYSHQFPILNAVQSRFGDALGPNCFQSVECGDAFVTELNTTGSSLIYSTYLGGADNEFGRGIAVDANGNAYVTGQTESPNFPVVNPLPPTTDTGQCSAPHALCFDAFVAKILGNPALPGNLLPIVGITVTPTTIRDNDNNGSESVTLDGSRSHDPGGSIVSYLWTENGRQITTGVHTTVTLPVGKHIVILHVTDNRGLISSGWKIVNVLPFIPPTNQWPIAKAGPDQLFTRRDARENNGATVVKLDGSGSSDPGASYLHSPGIVSYVWSEKGKQIAIGVTPTITLFIGEHSITLTVTDTEGATDTDSINITIKSLPPVARFTVSPQHPKAEHPVIFDASGSHDPDGKVVFYEWDFDRDGVYEYATNNSTVTFPSFPKGGSYNVGLRVTDNNGSQGTVSMPVNVKDVGFFRNIQKFIGNIPWPFGNRKKEITFSDVAFIKTSLNWNNRSYFDYDLRNALNTEMDASTGLTYGIYILSAINEMNEVNSVCLNATIASKYAGQISNAVVEWSNSTPSGVVDALLNILPSKSVGVDSILWIKKLLGIGISIKSLTVADTFNALCTYMKARNNSGLDDGAAWVAAITSISILSLSNPPSHTHFENIWDTYGEHWTESGGLDADFENQEYGKLRNILLDALGSTSVGRVIVEPHSPIEVQVFDSQGNLTGMINGQKQEGIPLSAVNDKTGLVVVFSPTGPLRFQTVGTRVGTYGLTITQLNGGAITIFNAVNVPTSPGAVHQYTIDWNALAQGRNGVTIQIDSNGDGTFEQTFVSGKTFNGAAPKPSIPIPTPKLISPHATRSIAEDATQPSDAGTLTEGETRWVVLQRLDICNGGFMAIRVPPQPPAHPTSYPSCEPFPTAVGPDPLLINILQVWRLAGHVPPGVKIPLRLCIDRDGDQRCGPGEALQELQADFSGNQPNVFGSFGKLLVDPGMGIPGLAPSNQGILGVGTSPQGVCPAGSTFAGKPCGVELIIEGNFAKAPSGTSLQIESWPMEQPLPDQSLNYTSQFVSVDIPNMNVHIAYPVVSAGVVRVIKRPSGQGQAPLIKEVRMQENSPAGPLGVEVEGRNIQSVRLEVFDLAGDRRYASAWAVGNRLTWNRLMSSGKPLANGVYLYLVEVRGYNGKIITSKVKKLVLLR